MLKEKPNKTLHIVIAEPSEMLRNGLSSIIEKVHPRYDMIKLSDYDDPLLHYLRQPHTLVIMNPILIINRIRHFLNIKETYPEVGWIALLHAYFGQQIVDLFDEVITLYDTPENIASKLRNMHDHIEGRAMTSRATALSDRETEVLLHLASGRSNKEIADILNISVNTVITHRKNITQKTGIKTVSGLTIYALSQGLIKP